MLSRSVASSLRSAVARPAVAGPSFRAAAVRLYSAEAEKPAEGADESAKKIAELEDKIAEMTKEMQYMRADYQTLTRRSAEEKVKASDFAIASFARALLTVPDILTTALKHVPQPIEKGTPLHEFFGGVELTKKSLLQTLDHHGVKPMDATVGTQFDPENHEAIFQVPAAVAPRAADGSERKAGEIMEVTKEGWMIKNRVLRPAQVGVVQIE